jgi:hypothetical protein
MEAIDATERVFNLDLQSIITEAAPVVHYHPQTVATVLRSAPLRLTEGPGSETGREQTVRAA